MMITRWRNHGVKAFFTACNQTELAKQIREFVELTLNRELNDLIELAIDWQATKQPLTLGDSLAFRVECGFVFHDGQRAKTEITFRPVVVSRATYGRYGH